VKPAKGASLKLPLSSTPPLRHDRKPFDPAEHGFEFSIDDIEGYLDGIRADRITRQTVRKEAHAALGRLAA
jgi:hypothetical protein